MGSGASREDVIASKWWEAKAHRMLITTTSTRDVELICALIPFVDEMTLLGLLSRRSDLDTLFTLHCKQNVQQSGDPSKLTDDIKAQELWRALRFPSGYRAPWDWNWQPPLSGDPSKIADDFHAAVCRAVFRVPLFNFVRYALGYSKALSIESLLIATRDVRTSLQSKFQHRPETKDTYIKVEKILQRRYHPLAHWIVASSLDNTTRAPHDALASTLDPIKNLFITRNLDLVLKRLAVFDRRFTHINQNFNWDNWSTDLDLWECIYQALWSEQPVCPSATLHLPSEDQDEKLRFLQSLESKHEDEVGIAWRKVWSLVKRPRRMRRQRAAEQSQHYDIKQRLQNPRISKPEEGKHEGQARR